MCVLTILLAVVVGVITSEQHISLVTADDQVKRTNDLVRRQLAEILLVKLRAVTPSEDVLLGMLCQENGLVESSRDLSSLSCVAG